VFELAGKQTMSTLALWKVLRDKLGAAADPARRITLQHLGLSDSDAYALQAVLDRVGEQLAVRLELQAHAGDIVLLEIDFAAHTSPQLLHAFNEERPVVLVAMADDDADDGRLLTAAEFHERRRQQLLRQLKDIALVRRRSPHWGPQGWEPGVLGFADDSARACGSFASAFDTDFDSVLDAEQLVAEELDGARRELLQAVLHGRRDPSAPILAASYGPGANLRFDFRAGVVTIDPLARQHLRLRRELPLPAAGACPQDDAPVQELDQVLWDLGLAGGRFPLLDEPADWWHTPLLAVPMPLIADYTRLPRHLELARRLQAGPVTPSQLRRQVFIGVPELRCFVQACLVLGLVRWQRVDAGRGVPRGRARHGQLDLGRA
jgi:hypothetical protein